MPQFYGESWALVHLLLFDDPSLNGPTLRYLELLNDQFPEPEAFASAFPFDKAALDLRLQKFIKAGRIHVMQYRLKNPLAVDDAPIKPLTPGQADAEMTRLVWQLGKPKVMVDELLAKSLAEQPDEPALRALAARIQAQQGSSISIDGLAIRMAGGINDLQERIDVAAALLDSNSGAAADREALAVLSDVLKLSAPPVEAVEIWSMAALRTGVGAEAIAAALEPLRARVPHDTTVLAALAAAYERMGEKVKSRNSYNQIILVSHSSQERSWAQQQADSARLSDAAPAR